MTLSLTFKQTEGNIESNTHIHSIYRDDRIVGGIFFSSAVNGYIFHSADGVCFSSEGLDEISLFMTRLSAKRSNQRIKPKRTYKKRRVGEILDDKVSDSMKDNRRG